jgi:hypothetical protein
VLPICVAWMVQVPAVSMLTVVPEAEQTPVVSELNVTVRLEDALALTLNVPPGE